MALGVYRHGLGTISHNEVARPADALWAWQALAPPRVHSIPHVGLTSAEIRRSGSRQERPAASDLEHLQLFQVRAVPDLGAAIATPR
jgi:hypothetical protein